MDTDETKMNKVFHEHSKKGKYQELVKKYPDVFKQLDSSLPMPYYLFGFEIGDGWFEILEVLAARIDYELQRDSGLNDIFYITQIKVKYGTLNFNVMGATQPILDAIDEAEVACCTTCELCGKDGERREDSGFLVVMCDKCWESYSE